MLSVTLSIYQLTSQIYYVEMLCKWKATMLLVHSVVIICVTDYSD